MIDLKEGNCLEIMPEIPDKSIDMILCDLPYGTTACKWDTIIPFELLWIEYNRIIKNNKCIALFGSEPFSSHLRMSNIKEFKNDWIWHKSIPSGMAFKYQPMRNHEIISIFGGKIRFNPINEPREGFTDGSKSRLASGNLSRKKFDGNPLYNIKEKSGGVKLTNFRKPTSIKRFGSIPSRGNEKVHHPTQKPVALLEYLIKTYTIEGETVLDNCMGSGSTGVACKNLNRNFIGIEKDKDYFEIAKKRINS